MSEKKMFYRNVGALVIPIALQNLMNVAVQSADVVMLGRVSEKALSAASLGGQVNFLFNLFLFGLTSGASVLCAQYWGKKDMHSIETITGFCLKYGLLVGVLVTAAAFFAPGVIMHILTSDEEVWRLGVSYLRVLGLSFLFMAVSNVYLNIMRSMERVVVSSVIFGISLVLNILVNAVLIFGMGPFPRLGVLGAAIGTLTARISECVMAWIHHRKYNNLIQYHIKLIFRKNKLLLHDFFVIASPVVLNEVMWAAGMSASAAIMGQLGSAASSANAIVQVVRQLSIVIGMGIASAAAIMIGKAIGEKKQDLAREYGKRFTRLMMISGFFAFLLVLMIRPAVLYIMELTPAAKNNLSIMMYMMSIYVWLQSVNTLYIVGIFRGGGDTRYGLYMEMAALWGCSVFFGAIATFVFHLSVPAVYAVILIDEYIKLPFNIWRYRSLKWLRDVTRD